MTSWLEQTLVVDSLGPLASCSPTSKEDVGMLETGEPKKSEMGVVTMRSALLRGDEDATVQEQPAGQGTMQATPDAVIAASNAALIPLTSGGRDHHRPLANIRADSRLSERQSCPAMDVRVAQGLGGLTGMG